jgi:hypothetical protein
MRHQRPTTKRFIDNAGLELKNPVASCEESSIPMEKNILIVAH